MGGRAGHICPANKIDVIVHLFKIAVKVFFSIFFHFFYIMVCWLDGWTINLSIGSRIPLRYFKVCLLFFPLIVMIKTCARNQLICLPSLISTMFKFILTLFLSLHMLAMFPELPSYISAMFEIGWNEKLFPCQVRACNHFYLNWLSMFKLI